MIPAGNPAGEGYFRSARTSGGVVFRWRPWCYWAKAALRQITWLWRTRIRACHHPV